MKLGKEVPSLRREDGSIKQISPYGVNLRNFHRTFLNQMLPALELFANRPTRILLYLMQTADSNNLIYCTHQSIMEDCRIRDAKVVSKTMKELMEAQIIAKVSQSHYMLNPAVMLQGNNQKCGMLMDTFERILRKNEKENR